MEVRQVVRLPIKRVKGVERLPARGRDHGHAQPELFGLPGEFPGRSEARQGHFMFRRILREVLG